jgi:hypothetical protein
MIKLTNNEFYSNRTFDKPLHYDLPFPIQEQAWVYLFDQNGYRLTKLEYLYAEANNHSLSRHGHEICLRQDWFTEEAILSGPHLNHAYLFERKGYDGDALNQLKEYAKQNNLVNKLINYRGKWGVDFSMDYVDEVGNSMEILHFEYDSYNLEEIKDIKGKVEEIVSGVDWDWAADLILKRKDEWINLEFSAQSEWKTSLFNLPNERFRMNAWE